MFGFVIDFNDAKVEAAIGTTRKTDVQRHVIRFGVYLEGDGGRKWGYEDEEEENEKDKEKEVEKVEVEKEVDEERGVEEELEEEG